MSLLDAVSLKQIEQVDFVKCNFKCQEYNVNNRKSFNSLSALKS